MKYKITSGEDHINSLFDELKNESFVTNSYIGKTVLTIYQGEEGIIYDFGVKKLTVISEKKSELLKKFDELADKKGIKLEAIK